MIFLPIDVRLFHYEYLVGFFRETRVFDFAVWKFEFAFSTGNVVFRPRRNSRDVAFVPGLLPSPLFLSSCPSSFAGDVFTNSKLCSPSPQQAATSQPSSPPLASLSTFKDRLGGLCAGRKALSVGPTPFPIGLPIYFLFPAFPKIVIYESETLVFLRSRLSMSLPLSALTLHLEPSTPTALVTA